MKVLVMPMSGKADDLTAMRDKCEAEGIEKLIMIEDPNLLAMAGDPDIELIYWEATNG